MYLYLLVLLFSVSVPLALSFDKKLQFYKQWKFVFPSILGVALFFILGDIYLTTHGVWGFNPRYHLDLVIFNLPLEEWLFFVFIPYASIFLHESLILYFPNLCFEKKVSTFVSLFFVLGLVLVIAFNLDKIYTVYILGLLVFAFIWAIFDKSNIIGSYYVTFLVILVPFLLVNAILTGSFIEEPVFWYKEGTILGIRIFTIPIEDFGYAFGMILFNLLLINRFKLMGIKKSSLSKTALL